MVRRGRRGRGSIFVGKLIVSKGVDLLLAAWPLVAPRNPGARLLVVGFGEYRGAARASSGRRSSAATSSPLREIAAAGRGARGRRGGAAARCWRPSSTRPPDGYAEAAPAAAGSVALRRPARARRGRARRSPAADALVFPSTFPEAFGMVAAEAAAAGVLPVSRRPLRRSPRSAASSRAALPGRARRAASRSRSATGAVEAIAERLNALARAARRPSARPAARACARRSSGCGAGRGSRAAVLAASAGDLDGLPRRSPIRCRLHELARATGAVAAINRIAARCPARPTLELVAAMVVLTVVQSVVLLQFDWFGPPAPSRRARSTRCST